MGPYLCNTDLDHIVCTLLFNQHFCFSLKVDLKLLLFCLLSVWPISEQNIAAACRTFNRVSNVRVSSNNMSFGS